MEAAPNSAAAPPVVVVSQVVPEEFTPALQDRTSTDFLRLEEVACAQVGTVERDSQRCGKEATEQKNLLLLLRCVYS